MISASIRNRLIEYFDGAKPYDTRNYMQKVDITPVKDIIAEFFDFNSVKFYGGNLYQHTYPYYPHVDGHPSWGEDGRVDVIPLRYEGAMPHLVVFDQRYKLGQITWSGKKRESDFVQNKNNDGRPYDSDILNARYEPIDEELYKHLSHKPKDFWFGLTGRAIPFEPGTRISMNCYQIHATSSMEGMKLGLTLRYSRR